MKDRTLHIGAKTVVIRNVPDEITDEELTRYAYAKLLEIGAFQVGQAS